MHSKHMPAATLLLAAALVIEAAGSLCLITGFGARIAATVMFFYMIPVTFLLHEFMSVNFQKNLGLMGGLLMITAFGPGRIALGPRVAPEPATD
jgi:putative oxidoreductase